MLDYIGNTWRLHVTGRGKDTIVFNTAQPVLRQRSPQASGELAHTQYQTFSFILLLSLSFKGQHSRLEDWDQYQILHCRPKTQSPLFSSKKPTSTLWIQDFPKQLYMHARLIAKIHCRHGLGNIERISFATSKSETEGFWLPVRLRYDRVQNYVITAGALGRALGFDLNFDQCLKLQLLNPSSIMRCLCIWFVYYEMGSRRILIKGA